MSTADPLLPSPDASDGEPDVERAADVDRDGDVDLLEGAGPESGDGSPRESSLTRPRAGDRLTDDELEADLDDEDD